MQGRIDEKLGLFFCDNVKENGEYAGKTIPIAEAKKGSNPAEKPKAEKPKAEKDDE